MSMYCPYTYLGFPKGLDYPWKFPMPSTKERDIRWQAVRKAMEKNRFDCIIPSALSTFIPSSKYITFLSNYVPFATHGVYLVFPLHGEPRMAFSNNNGPQFVHMATESGWINELVDSINPVRDAVQKLKELKLHKGRIGIPGYKKGLFSAAAMDYLRENLPEAEFSDATGMMTGVMNELSRTSEEELKFLKKACEILDLSFNAVTKILKPGISELDIWAEVEYTILKNGGWSHHNMIITTAQRPLFPRAPASHRNILPGDVGIFEIICSYGGVTPQTCYAVSLGEPEAKVRDMFDFCEGLYQFSLAEFNKKRLFKDIEGDLGKRIHSAGYEPMTPQIHVYNMSMEIPMESQPHTGDYFTVHPNLVDPRYSVGAKLGDIVRIGTDGKVERLQNIPACLNVVPL